MKMKTAILVACAGTLALAANLANAQSAIIPTVEAHITVKKNHKGENETPRPTNRVHFNYNYQKQNKSGKSNAYNADFDGDQRRMGKGGGGDRNANKSNTSDRMGVRPAEQRIRPRIFLEGN